MKGSIRNLLSSISAKDLHCVKNAFARCVHLHVVRNSRNLLLNTKYLLHKFSWVLLNKENVCGLNINCNTLNHNKWIPVHSKLEEQHVEYSFIHSFSMCRMRRFLAVLRSFFHSSLLCTFPCHPSPPTILPSPLNSFWHLFLGLPLNLLVRYKYKIPFWEFYFIPLSVHDQTNVIYLTLLSLLQ